MKHEAQQSRGKSFAAMVDKAMFDALSNQPNRVPPKARLVLMSLANKGNWRAAARLQSETFGESDKLLDKALNSKYRTPFLDEIKNEFFILRLKGEI